MVTRLPERARPISRRAVQRWQTRSLASALVASAIAMGAFSASAGGTSRARGAPTASAARSLSVKDEGRLRLVKSSGSQLIDEGPASGTIPGRVRIVFVYDGNPTVSAQITIYGDGGSIQAHGTAALSSPTSASPSFKGTLAIAGGAGRYAHARGTGQLYGVFFRRSYAITVQTQGTLHY
jgi:hypothetical protein